MPAPCNNASSSSQLPAPARAPAMERWRQLVAAQERLLRGEPPAARVWGMAHLRWQGTSWD